MSNIWVQVRHSPCNIEIVSERFVNGPVGRSGYRKARAHLLDEDVLGPMVQNSAATDLGWGCTGLKWR